MISVSSAGTDMVKYVKLARENLETETSPCFFQDSFCCPGVATTCSKLGIGGGFDTRRVPLPPWAKQEQYHEVEGWSEFHTTQLGWTCSSTRRKVGNMVGNRMGKLVTGWYKTFQTCRQLHSSWWRESNNRLQNHRHPLPESQASGVWSQWKVRTNLFQWKSRIQAF